MLLRTLHRSAPVVVPPAVNRLAQLALLGSNAVLWATLH